MNERGLLSTTDEYFESIRPFLDQEVKPALRSIIEEEEVQQIIRRFFGELSKEEMLQMADDVQGVYDFKENFLAPVAQSIRDKSTFSLTISGKSKLDRSGAEKYLFISNHRDIILDSAFLNLLCLENGMSMPRIAIGDNLLLTDWIYKIVRLADAFIVKRSLPIRELLEESKRLSAYMRSSVVLNEESVWLAQSEGRRKDSDDRTQTAVLKMLNLSAGDLDYAEALQELKITPIAITYEYDPCDYLKAKEMLARKLDPKWTKGPIDDLVSMQTGLEGYKGRVHFAIGETLRDISSVTSQATNKQEILESVAKEIDRQIFTNYRFYPNNYIAFDELHGGAEFGKMFSDKERKAFIEYIEGQIKKTEVSDDHYTFVRERLLEMYAIPLRNHLITTKKYR